MGAPARAEHIFARLGFVRALFSRLGRGRLVLYRGMAICGPLQTPRNHTFISATFSRRVASSHFDAGIEGSTGVTTRVLLSQAVAVERAFMTFYETAAMNAKFREAEAVLLWDGGATF
jgi:hypothetical protein